MKSALLAGVLVSAAAALLYAANLDRVPVYFHHDEVNFARHAHALATAGTDLEGNRYPVFFQEPGYSIGRDPVYMYATAALLRMLPWRESTFRIAPVAAALATIVLVVLIGAELFSSTLAGIAAGVLLAVSPAFFIHARMALSVIFPALFIAWWLLFLLRYVRTGARLDLALATVGIGAGLYAYLGMAVLLPIYTAVTVGGVLWRKAYRDLAIMAGCLALCSVPILVWQVTHPDRYTQMVSSYGLYDPRFDVYWQAYNPGRLFFTGESPLVFSTRQAGTFPLAFLLLWPIGIVAMMRAPLFPRAVLVLVGLATAPLPGVMVGNASVHRYLGIMVFGTLVATAGLWRLWVLRAAWARAVAVLSMVASLWLFQSFHRFYLNNWPVMASPDQGGNLRGALDAVLLTTPDDGPQQLYLSSRITYVDSYFDLYARLRQREDLRARTVDLTRDDWRRVAERSIAIVGGADQQSITALTEASWRPVYEVKGLDGSVDYVLFGSPP